MTPVDEAIALEWRMTPMSGKWVADTRIGRVTLAMKKAGKHRGHWQATLESGVRIAAANNSNACKRAVEAHLGAHQNQKVKP